MNEDETRDWSHKPGETAEDYAERVGGRPDSNVHMCGVLEREFGKSEEDAKRLCLSSRSFSEGFFREQLSAMLVRGGSRYGAVNYVRRKSDWKDDEITKLVDSIGRWES